MKNWPEQLQIRKQYREPVRQENQVYRQDLDNLFAPVNATNLGERDRELSAFTQGQAQMCVQLVSSQRRPAGL